MSCCLGFITPVEMQLGEDYAGRRKGVGNEMRRVAQIKPRKSTRKIVAVLAMFELAGVVVNQPSLPRVPIFASFPSLPAAPTLPAAPRLFGRPSLSGLPASPMLRFGGGPPTTIAGGARHR